MLAILLILLLFLFIVRFSVFIFFRSFRVASDDAVVAADLFRAQVTNTMVH